MRTGPAPTSDPFASPPAPARSMPEALLAAYHAAWGDWREYLPHGLSIAAYATCQPDWLFELAVHSAAAPLTPQGCSTLSSCRH